MNQTIDMNHIRYLNLFEKVTKVRTKHCFKYNDFLVFAVPVKLVSKAIGEKGKNVKKLSRILNKKIKIVPLPKNNSEEETKNFIVQIIKPLGFKNMKIDEKNSKIQIKAGRQNKAALIGRGRQREKELNEIARSFFSKEIEII